QVSDGSNPNYSFGAVVTIPLGNTAARSDYKGKQLQKKGLLLISKTLERDILIQVDNAVKKVQYAFERIDATRQARIYGETALSAEQKKLDSGKSTSFQVLQFQRDLTSSRLEEVGALKDCRESISDLYFQEGSILEHNHVGVEVK